MLQVRSFLIDLKQSKKMPSILGLAAIMSGQLEEYKGKK